MRDGTHEYFDGGVLVFFSGRLKLDYSFSASSTNCARGCLLASDVVSCARSFTSNDVFLDADRWFLPQILADRCSWMG